MISRVRYLTETEWPGTISLRLSFESPRDYISKDEIETLWKRNPRLHVSVAMSSPEGETRSGHTGRIDARFVRAAVPDIVLHRAHICGPTPMTDAVKAVLLDLGVPAGQIRTESFGTDRRDPTEKVGKSGEVVGKVKFLASRRGRRGEGPHRQRLSLRDLRNLHGEAESRDRSHVGAGRLSDGDREDGYILACQAEPEGDVVLEA